jgi:hypothetical protein
LNVNVEVVSNPSIGVGGMDANDDRGDGDYSMGLVCLSGAMRDCVVGEYKSDSD